MRLEQTKLRAKDIAGALNECKFNPADKGPQNVAARTNDVSYNINRAIEELVSEKPGYIESAIKFLAIAKAISAQNANLIGD